MKTVYKYINIQFYKDISQNEVGHKTIELVEKVLSPHSERNVTIKARQISLTPKSDKKVSMTVPYQMMDNQSAKEEAEIQKEKKKEEIVNQQNFKLARKRVFTMLKDEKKFVIGAGIAAACNGAVWPIYGILLADATAALALDNLEDVKQQGTLVAIFFVILAVCAGGVLWMQK
jgi:hypothetical protein